MVGMSYISWMAPTWPNILVSAFSLNTLSWDKMAGILQKTFQINFLEWKNINLDYNFTTVIHKIPVDNGGNVQVCRNAGSALIEAEWRIYVCRSSNHH